MTDNKCIGFTVNGNKCGYKATIGNCCSKHYDVYGTDKIVAEVGSDKYNSLLIIKSPHLIKEWDFEKNKGININGIAHASTINVWWICPRGHSYQNSPHNRTKNGCGICVVDDKRVYDKDTVIKIKNGDTPKNNERLIAGDNSEYFIANILRDTKLYKEIVQMGNISGNGDIMIRHHDDSINFIQIKTISYKESYYSFNNNTKYPDDMLIVAVNRERDKFVLDFYKNLNARTIALHYNNKNSKYKHIMYTSIQEFTKKLIELIPFSVTKNIMTEHRLKEFAMLERLSSFCEKNNLNFVRNTTDSNPIDGYINGLSFQAKYRSFQDANTYCIDCKKYSGAINRKQIKKPYDENDFDLMIVELEGTDGEFHNQFCIIPKSVLISVGILKTETCKGKTTFRVCKPDYNKNHWSKNYWNNLSIFQKKKVRLNILGSTNST